MKRILFYYFFFIFTSYLFSQSGEIIYEAEILNEDLKNQPLDNTFSKGDENFLKKINNNISNLDFILTFSKFNSIFKKQDKMKINDRSLDIAVIIAGKGVYYTSHKEGITLIEKEFSGKTFLIEIPNTKWKLIQEEKKVGKYVCYKATTIKTTEGRNGKIKKKITAWYSPQIPYNFGPKDYNGLPGLILQLQEDNLLITAKKITIQSTNQISIEKPTKGEKVTQQEFDSIVKKLYFERRRIPKQ